MHTTSMQAECPHAAGGVLASPVLCLSVGATAKNLRRGGDLFFNASVVTDDQDTIVAIYQLSAALSVPGCLRGLVVDRSVAEDADVRGVEKVRDAVGFGNWLLRFVGQTMETVDERVEKPPFHLGT